MTKNSAPVRDLVCFSHLRWNFVYQRPQHLLSRAVQNFRVHFIEEPKYEDCAKPRLDVSREPCGVNVVVPVIPEETDREAIDVIQRRLIDGYLRTSCPSPHVGWYYTPMALRFTSHLSFPVCVYDCMDELSCFKNAPTELRVLERELLARAHVVFTGGQSLYEAKCGQHANVHAFPSSVDAAHFLPARSTRLPEPADMAALGRPRVGWFGVIDERLDIGLVDGIASAQPDWHLVMIGPVVKIDPASLPRRPNIHWLGGKAYTELPTCLSALDVGFMPFAINEATRFISPTKTPEFLAAGVPVVSTPITDVARTWGAWGLVSIAADTSSFVRAIEGTLAQRRQQNRSGWLATIDRRLASTSWDTTWAAMHDEIGRAQLAPRRRERARAVFGVAEVSHV
jgi:UDP-galactopyranose mutase